MKPCVDNKSVSEIVDSLFMNGMTPAKFYGIDTSLIEAVEMSHPEISKQYPR